jgi:hypothetical protein
MDLPEDPRPSYYHWSDYFKTIDMYGVTPTLEIQGKRKHKTWYGCFMSFMVIVVIIFYALVQLCLVFASDDFFLDLRVSIEDMLMVRFSDTTAVKQALKNLID